MGTFIYLFFFISGEETKLMYLYKRNATLNFRKDLIHVPDTYIYIYIYIYMCMLNFFSSVFFPNVLSSSL